MSQKSRPKVLDDDFVRSPLSCLECILEAYVGRVNRPHISPYEILPLRMMKMHAKLSHHYPQPCGHTFAAAVGWKTATSGSFEGMLWHMRSHLHSLTLPFDMLGFPILEARTVCHLGQGSLDQQQRHPCPKDERNFGAFRGRLRPTSNRLFLDPLVADASASLNAFFFV